jgi:hypothetical protein
MRKCLFWQQFVKKLRKKEKNRIWMNDIFVSRGDEGGFHTLSNAGQKPRVTQAVFPQDYCVSHQVKLSSVFAPPM